MKMRQSLLAAGPAAMLWLAGCGGSGPAAATSAAAPPPATAAAAAPAHAEAANSLVTVSASSAGNFVTEAVKEQSVADGIRSTGHLTVNDHRTWRVGAITEGRLVKVLVNPGDRVAAGQVLARMHSHAVHDGRADYRKALTELARAKSAQAYAEQMRDRAKRLYGLKAAALEQVERTEAEVKQAQSAVTQAETEVERAKTHLVDFLQVAADEPAVAEGQHHDDELIPVKAPAGGVLLERKVTAGSVVATAAEMFVISDLSSLWMQAALPEAAISGVRPGQAVRVEVQAHPGRSFPGRVIKLGEQLEADTRTLPVRIELANAAGLLKPEMYGDVQWSSGPAGSRGGLFVSETALQDVKGQSTLFVDMGEGRYEARVVETGRSLDGRVQVLSGLAAGDKVVVKGAFVLKSQLLKKALADGE